MTIITNRRTLLLLALVFLGVLFVYLGIRVGAQRAQWSTMAAPEGAETRLPLLPAGTAGRGIPGLKEVSAPPVLSQSSTGTGAQASQAPGTGGGASPSVSPATGGGSEPAGRTEPGTAARPLVTPGTSAGGSLSKGASVSSGEEKKALDPRSETWQDKGPDAFFVDYRMERERQRSRWMEIWQGMVENPASPTPTRQEAQSRLLDLTQRMEQELEAESLIVAKGYDDAVVVIQPGAVIAVVRSTALSEADVNRIADLVAKATGRKLEEVVVIARR